MNREEKISVLRNRIKNEDEISSIIDDLKSLLSADCAELDKARVG